MSERERQLLVEMARNRGFSNEDILKEIVTGTGGDERRQIIVDWAKALGIASSEALQLARSAGLIPSTHPPRAAVAGSPLHKTPESSDE